MVDPNYKVPVWVVASHVFSKSQWTSRNDVHLIDLDSVTKALDRKLETFFGPNMTHVFLEVVKSFVGSFILYEYLIGRVRKNLVKQREDLSCTPVVLSVPALMVPRLILACQKNLEPWARCRSFLYQQPTEDDILDATPW